MNDSDDGFQERYVAHLRSEYWARLRAVKLGASSCCERCGASWGRKLELHHKHYRTFGHEGQNDVEALCKACHDCADAARAADGKKRSLLGRYRAKYITARNTFMTKLYGGDWQLLSDGHEFDQWMEKKVKAGQWK